jgi:hypothetical protein
MSLKDGRLWQWHGVPETDRRIGSFRRKVHSQRTHRKQYLRDWKSFLFNEVEFIKAVLMLSEEIVLPAPVDKGRSD